MKTTTIFIIATVLQLVCLGFIAVNFMESNDRDRLKQVEIDHLKKEIKEQADSLEKQLALTRDSLSIAFETIRLATKEREEAHARTQKTIKDLQRIVFIQYESDSARLNALKKLYPMAWQTERWNERNSVRGLTLHRSKLAHNEHCYNQWPEVARTILEELN